MKTIIHLFLLFITITIFQSACTSQKHLFLQKSLEQHQFTVSTNPLKRVGDEVMFTLSVQVPKKLLGVRNQYILDVIFVPDDVTKFVRNLRSKDEIKVGEFMLEGRDFQHSNADPKQTKTLSFKYKDKYQQGYLAGYVTFGMGNSWVRTGPILITSKQKPITGIVNK